MVGGVPDSNCVIDAGWALLEKDGEQRLARDVSIVVRGDLIAAVVEGRWRGSDRRVDATTMLVMPSFTSGHTHSAASSPPRGLIEGGRFWDQPVKTIDRLDDPELDALTAWNLYEMTRSGCTLYLEMSLSVRHAESFVRVADRLGLRAYVSVISPSVPRLFDIWYRGSNDQILSDSVPETLAQIDESIEFGRRLGATGNDRLRPQMGFHAADTHTPETIAAVLRGADELGNGIHFHLAQRIREGEAVRRQWGMGPVEWLESLGVFDRRPAIAAHLYKMDPEVDLPILKRNAVTFAHCACMASILHQSSQPLPEALAAGLNVILGIDQMSNDYLENIKTATLSGRHRVSLLEGHSSVPMQRPAVEDVIRAATKGGPFALGRSDLGVIEPGAKADLVAVDITSTPAGLGALPPEPLQHLLYANATAVRHVMTGGTFQLLNGVFVADDEERLIAEGAIVHRRIWKHLREQGWFDTPPQPESRG